MQLVRLAMHSHPLIVLQLKPSRYASSTCLRTEVDFVRQKLLGFKSKGKGKGPLMKREQWIELRTHECQMRVRVSDLPLVQDLFTQGYRSACTHTSEILRRICRQSVERDRHLESSAPERVSVYWEAHGRKLNFIQTALSRDWKLLDGDKKTTSFHTKLRASGRCWLKLLNLWQIGVRDLPL